VCLSRVGYVWGVKSVWASIVGSSEFRVIRIFWAWKKRPRGWVLVAHATSYSGNPSYSESRDQEDCSSKPTLANSSRDPILKIPITKNGWQSGSRWRSWVQAPVPQKKKKKRTKGNEAKGKHLASHCRGWALIALGLADIFSLRGQLITEIFWSKNCDLLSVSAQDLVDHIRNIKGETWNILSSFSSGKC
jgi:hypothetical protein